MKANEAKKRPFFCDSKWPKTGPSDDGFSPFAGEAFGGQAVAAPAEPPAHRNGGWRMQMRHFCQTNPSLPRPVLQERPLLRVLSALAECQCKLLSMNNLHSITSFLCQSQSSLIKPNQGNYIHCYPSSNPAFPRLPSRFSRLLRRH